MDYSDYAADTSPHFSSTMASPSTTAENANAFAQQLQPMNQNFSSSTSTTVRSPQSNNVAFSANSLQPHHQQQPSPSSSLNAERQFRMLTASSTPAAIDTTAFDRHDASNATQRAAHELPRSVHLAARASHAHPAMMPDYWHGQTPLLLNNLHVHELDNVEVNHSERGIAGFVSKLYQSLQAPDNEQKYARWCRHDGKDMFIIECIPKFTEVVLPRLFKHCKFASFVRQLNIYGFQRDTDARKTKDTRDKESCRWYHPYFRPGRRDLFHLIRRKAARYPRRKRVKVEEDPETIVNVGDDSDTELMNDDDRRRSSSVSSSAISQPQHDNQSMTDAFLPYGSTPPTDMLPAAGPSSSSSAIVQQQQPPPLPHPPVAAVVVAAATATATAAQPPVPTTPIQPPPSLGPPQAQPPTTSATPGAVIASLPEQSPTSTMTPPPPSAAITTPAPCMAPDMTRRERDMHTQMMKVSQGYHQLAAQMKHACEVIEMQERRIQILETALLRHQQVRGQHRQRPAPHPTDMGYLGNGAGGSDPGGGPVATGDNTFTNHPSPANTTDLYTQLFPHPGVRIKTEMAAAAPTPFENMLLPSADGWVYDPSHFSSPPSARPSDAAATVAAVAAAATTNGGPATDHQHPHHHTPTPGGPGDMTTFGLAAAAATRAKYASAATHPHPEQHPHHSHHPHPHQAQQHRHM